MCVCVRKQDLALNITRKPIRDKIQPNSWIVCICGNNIYYWLKENIWNFALKLTFECDIVVSEFKLQLAFYAYFWATALRVVWTLLPLKPMDSIVQVVREHSQGWPEGSLFNSYYYTIATTTPRYRGGRYSFPWIAPLTLDPYFIMLIVKQGGIKYHI